MNKTKFFSSLLVVALFATASVVTSCKDYDDDIKNLQSQIDGINKTLSQIQTLISSGSVITDVKTLTDGTGGVEIFLSNNKSYKIYNGAKGETGATGAQGEKGDKGDKGDTGAAGADGVAPVLLSATTATGSSMVLTLASPLAVRRVRLVLPVLPVLRVPRVTKVTKVTRVMPALLVQRPSTMFLALRVKRRASG